MKDILISILRQRDVTPAQYREATEKLGAILAYEAAQILGRKKIDVETPLEKTEGSDLLNDVVLVPVLRSGLALLPPFLHLFENAKIGLIGLKRDEQTAIPNKYYQNLPKINPNEDVIVLEPMIATGGSAAKALNILRENGVRDEKLMLVSVIGTPEGLKAIQATVPKLRIVLAQLDRGLNAQKFILPGLGDFGDRYFLTEYDQ